MFWTRLFSGIGLLGIFVAVYLLSATLVLNCFVAVVAAACIYELFKAIAVGATKQFFIPSLILSLFVPFAMLLSWDVVLAAVMVYVLAFFVFLLMKYGVVALDNAVTAVFYTLFIVLSLATFVALAAAETRWVTLPLVFAASMTDVFAYLVGITLGRHKFKLVEKISPKKTVEGTVGGILGCGAFIYGYAVVINHTTHYSINLPVLIVLGVLISVVSQIGDYSMSLIKRTYGIKDFSNLIPGHGGVLDRMDSWLFVMPVIFLFLKLFNFVS
jgi:phosphatidate cytidylyltransferase